jgi:hypothetical protein
MNGSLPLPAASSLPPSLCLSTRPLPTLPSHSSVLLRLPSHRVSDLIAVLVPRCVLDVDDEPLPDISPEPLHRKCGSGSGSLENS